MSLRAHVLRAVCARRGAVCCRALQASAPGWLAVESPAAPGALARGLLLSGGALSPAVLLHMRTRQPPSPALSFLLTRCPMGGSLAWLPAEGAQGHCVSPQTQVCGVDFMVD